LRKRQIRGLGKAEMKGRLRRDRKPEDAMRGRQLWQRRGRRPLGGCCQSVCEDRAIGEPAPSAVRGHDERLLPCCRCDLWRCS
jgi:hypothetical protein